MNFLNFPNWQIIDVTENRSHFFFRAAYKSNAVERCPECRSTEDSIRKYGVRIRSVKDAPVRGKPVAGQLTVQKYVCVLCDSVFSAHVPELGKDSRLTRRLVSYIERQSVDKTFMSVSGETGIAEKTVRDIFFEFSEEFRRTYLPACPKILGVDDVYVNRKSRCILTDIENNKIIDILPGRDVATIYEYFCRLKTRGTPEVVTMDMCRPFFDTVKSAFPRCEVVIDTFHVQRMGNEAMNVFLRRLRNSLGASRRRIYLHDRFLLMKRSYNLTEEEKAILRDWKAKLPELAKVYDLKEEFFMIWRVSGRKNAERKYERWRKKISPEIRFAFNEILGTIENWHHEIFNYFDYKVTNAFTESANNLVKSAQRQCRRCSFNILRTKILCKSLGYERFSKEKGTD